MMVTQENNQLAQSRVIKGVNLKCEKDENENNLLRMKTQRGRR